MAIFSTLNIQFLTPSKFAHDETYVSRGYFISSSRLAYLEKNLRHVKFETGKISVFHFFHRDSPDIRFRQKFLKLKSFFRTSRSIEKSNKISFWFIFSFYRCKPTYTIYPLSLHGIGYTIPKSFMSYVEDVFVLVILTGSPR